MNKYKMISFFMTIMMIFSLSAITIHADTQTTIKANNVIAEGSSVSIPIRLSGNTGICGAAITVSYNQSLVLTDIENGEALSSLTMTKPGNLSGNPIKLLWDGLEPDNTNGIIATLKFTAPKNSGVYDISISCDNGDIVDGNLLPIYVTTVNGSITVSEQSTENTPTISIGNIMAKTGSQVEVPISISGNTGICGAALSISYDNALTLSNIYSGSALSSLTMTKPGNMELNPFKLIWDGLDTDNSNGTMVVLTFTVPTNPGTYNVSASYNDGDIVDGNLNPVGIRINQGQIKAVISKDIVVEIANKKVTMTGEKDANNEVIVAFYNIDKKLLSVKSYEDTDNTIKISNTENAAYAKVMLWESLNTLKPLDKVQTITLK